MKLAEVARTLVYGSEALALDCVRLEPERFHVSRFVSRQSVISAMSRKVNISPTVNTGASERRALDDAAGSLAMWVRLERNDTDLVVWDVSDERFGVERCGEGAYRTCTPDYFPFSDQLAAFASREYIAFGTDEHFDLFRLAAARFVALLNAVGLGSRTIVLAPELAYRDTSGMACLDVEVVERMREQFRRYYRYLHEVCELPIILLPGETVRVDAEHKWGPAPFHFSGEVLRNLSHGLEDFSVALDARSRASRQAVLRSSYHEAAASAPIELDDFDWLDGVHRLVVEGRQIDVLVRFEGRRDVDMTPVMFSGALSPGQDVRGPIFSGRDICEQLDLPLVAISDPSIGLRPGLELAWYVGSQWCSAQDAIHKILARLHGVASRKPLLVGGSGGGFAALEQLVRGRQSGADGWGALVWNPQLDIARYGSASVARFLATCFPSAYLRYAGQGLGEVLSQSSADWGFISELYSAAKGGWLENSFIIQERGDWHFAEYIEPLLALVDAETGQDGSWRADPAMFGFSGDWGGGHTPPPRELLILLLECASTEGLARLPDRARSWFENRSRRSEE